MYLQDQKSGKISNLKFVKFFHSHRLVEFIFLLVSQETRGISKGGPGVTSPSPILFIFQLKMNRCYNAQTKVLGGGKSSPCLKNHDYAPYKELLTALKTFVEIPSELQCHQSLGCRDREITSQQSIPSNTAYIPFIIY